MASFFYATHFYNIKLNSFFYYYVEEVMMRDDLEPMYHRLGYEEGFDPSEVLYSLQRKILTDTRATTSATIRAEWKEIFGEGGVLDFFPHVWLYFTDKMDKLQMFSLASS